MVDDMTVAGDGRYKWATHTRTPRPQRVGEPGTEGIIGPIVDNGIPTTATDRQPVASDPDQLDMFEVPDGWLEVTEYCDAV